MQKEWLVVCMTNLKKANISYQYRDEIQRLFKENIEGELCIDHFSVNVFFGNNESIFLSPTPKMAEELCKKNFVSEDSNYKKDVYTKHVIYPWRAVEKTQMDSVINHIKEEKFGLRYGMMIVRDLGQGRHVMYSFATHKKEHVDGLFYFLYHSKANHIARMGDFMYNELNPIINEYAQKENVYMPKIDTFKSIDLEPSFDSEFQRDLFHATKDGNLKTFTRSIERKTARVLNLFDHGLVKQ